MNAYSNSYENVETVIDHEYIKNFKRIHTVMLLENVQ